MRSETISELAKALSKAQAAIQPAIKDTENPFFKSSYADLSAVWEVARKPLTENGLSVSQLPGECKDNKVILQTILMHESGEYLCSILEMPYLKNDPQSIGSAITYARRYALAAIVGIVADEDDDGNGAAGKTDKEKTSKSEKTTNNQKSQSVATASEEKRAKLYKELCDYCKTSDGEVDKAMLTSVLKEISTFDNGKGERFITDIFADKSPQGTTISESWVNSCIGKLRKKTGKEAA